MRITWEADAGPAIGMIVAENGRTRLVQTDWDCPGVAETFGWSIRRVQRAGRRRKAKRCDHRHTDGTADCPDCGVRVGEFIDAAHEWLCGHDGAVAEDPGYFEE